MTRSELPIYDLATHLLSEASRSDEDLPAAVQVLERLDTVLVRVAGQAGSRSLMERALSLARYENPTLLGLHIPATGPLTGMRWKIADPGPYDRQNDQVILVAHVLELLQIFIGERLTFQLVKEAWPDLDLNSDLDPPSTTP